MAGQGGRAYLSISTRVAPPQDSSCLAANDASVRYRYLFSADRKASEYRGVLEITPARDCHLELWEVRNHEKAFEKVFGRKLTIRLLESQASQSA